ncbi:MFS-type transporter SLC18B1 [Nymphon striatum]|nr:MFS-type transporter SLC18B1 [Nymphon striatum]
MIGETTDLTVLKFSYNRSGMSISSFGFLLATYRIVNFIMSPICASVIRTFGGRCFLSIGFIVSGVSNICMGAMEYSPDGIQFSVLIFMTMFMISMGNTAAQTALYAIVTEKFHHHVGSVMGWIEMSYGIGSMLSTGFGGVLFELSGFWLPFFVSGIILLLTSTLALFGLPHHETISDFVIENHHHQQQPQLGPPAEQKPSSGTPFAISQAQVGFVFLGLNITYSIFSVIWGKLIDKFVNIKFVVSSLLVGGIASSAIVVSAFKANIAELIIIGFANNIRTTAIVSSISTASIAFGSEGKDEADNKFIRLL